MSTACKRHSGGQLLVAMLVALPAGAADLAADAVRTLVSGRTWTTTKVINYARTDTWQWKADGTLCLRLDSAKGKCHDSGTWTIDGANVCYKLDWWQKSAGLSSACFSVTELGNGNYEAKIASGFTVLAFTVAPKK